MTRLEQLRAFDELAARALEMVLDDLAKNADHVIRVARARLVAGYDEYGSAMWSQHPDLLYADEVEEVADAVNYRVAAMWPAERTRLSSS